MVRVNGTTISITRGDSADLDFFIIGPDGEPVTLEAEDKIAFQIRTTEIYTDDDETSSEVMLEGFMDYNSETDKATWHISSNDTKRFDAGEYVWDAQVQYANGNVYTFISISRFVVTPEVTTLVTVADDATGGAIVNTEGSNSAKRANLDGYVLVPGTYVMVTVINDDESEGQMTLDINYTGAIPITVMETDHEEGTSRLPRGTYLVYYDGTNYNFQRDGDFIVGTQPLSEEDYLLVWRRGY